MLVSLALRFWPALRLCWRLSGLLTLALFVGVVALMVFACAPRDPCGGPLDPTTLRMVCD